MGSITLKGQSGEKVKVSCFSMVLSHSRYKYAFWQDHPRQLVYDQDRVMTVSENHGDILFTEGFRIYADALHVQVYLCRGADPETKGEGGGGCKIPEI